MNVLDIARQLNYVKELPGNKGQRVEGIQHWCGGAAGDSWCAGWATFVLDIAYKGLAPVKRTMGCDAILEAARTDKLLTDKPAVGDLYLRLKSKHDAHHVGFVTDVSRWDKEGVLGTISGNTSKDGTSSNGDAVYEHDISIGDRSTVVFVHYDKT